MVRTRLFYIMQMKTQQKSGAEFINIDLIIRNDVNQKNFKMHISFTECGKQKQQMNIVKRH